LRINGTVAFRKAIGANKGHRRKCTPSVTSPFLHGFTVPVGRHAPFMAGDGRDEDKICRRRLVLQVLRPND